LAQLEHIEAIERRLWQAADNLRSNSGLSSNEYFLPVMGLVFLRHAYSRFLNVKTEIEASLPTRGGKARDLTKEDFSERSAIFLQPNAQFDHLVGLPDSQDRAKAIIAAMDSIESDYDSLKGVLPKGDYQEIDNDVLGDLLRQLNPDELKKVSGDVFGRIYEYFLTKFAGEKAHDGGEFFTPISLVSLIAHVLDPESGTVLDPACGSGGMFVQSARTVEEQGDRASDRLTFRGLEKNATTIRLAKMNLAVHGLEGDIQQAITYYEDPHELVGQADYVMANPPFNVDEIDAGKIKSDPRLSFGLPGVNKEGKVTTAGSNYVWISYFHSYLSEQGRAGFVMSSQASSAGGTEAKVRQKLIETGDVAAMVAIRSGFFYTRTVPCELWFLNRDKNTENRDKVLMLDARNVNRKVTRVVYDFSPEQEKNLLSIFWLYRGETDRYLGLVSEHLGKVIDEGQASFSWTSEDGEPLNLVPNFSDSITNLRDLMDPFLKSQAKDQPHAAVMTEFDQAIKTFTADSSALEESLAVAAKQWDKASDSNKALNKLVEQFEPVGEAGRNFIKQIDLVYKLAARLIDTCEKECDAKASSDWSSREINKARKDAEQSRREAVEQLKKIRYFWRQAHWLTSRFPDAELCDVEGLVKLVDHAELKDNDWALTPGRYVGVAPEEVDEDFDFEEAIHDIHVELEELNQEAAELAATIKKNFEGLGV
jgi:type I restriction enzyme M protein